MNDRVHRLRDHIGGPHLDGDICLRCWAVDEIERLQADNADIKQRCDVLRIELAQARTGKALLEVERLEAENRELRERLAAGFASSVVIDVSHDDAARKLRQVMRALEAITAPDGGTQ